MEAAARRRGRGDVHGPPRQGSRGRGVLHPRNVSRPGTPAEWEPLFHGFTHLATGMEVSCVTDTPSLVAHGEDMDHCVGQGLYTTRLLLGEARIVAVILDGRAVATAHVREVRDGALVLGQCSGNAKGGRRNPPASPTAVGAFREALAEARLHSPPVPPDAAGFPDAGCGTETGMPPVPPLSRLSVTSLDAIRSGAEGRRGRWNAT